MENVLPQIGIAVDRNDNVAELVYPLVQFVEQKKPDYIFACDRGARFIGLAVHMLYGRLYGAFPTQDHAIHFRKISGYVPADAVRKALQPDVERMLVAREYPTILVLDDFIATGGTKSLVYKLFTELSGGKAKILYGVMRGNQGDGADVTGSKDSISSSSGDWLDMTNLIGVDYDYVDGMLRPRRIPSAAAIDYRRRISASIQRFVKGLSA